MMPGTKFTLVRSLLGAVLVLFFMPFSTLSCGGVKLITMNGVQMATGTTITAPERLSDNNKQKEIKPNALAITAGIAAMLALGLAFAGGAVGKFGSAAFAAATALALLIMKSDVESDVLRQGQGVVGVQWEFGFWLAVLVAIGAVVAALLPTKHGTGVDSR